MTTTKEERKEQAREAVEMGEETRVEKGQTWVMVDATSHMCFVDETWVNVKTGRVKKERH